MTLLICNADVARVLSMETTMVALQEAYVALAARKAVCRPRIDIRIPTSDPAKNYKWGTMEVSSTAGRSRRRRSPRYVSRRCDVTCSQSDGRRTGQHQRTFSHGRHSHVTRGRPALRLRP